MISIRDAKKEIEDILIGVDGVVGVGISPDNTKIRVYLKECDTFTLASIPDNIAGYEVEKKCTGSFSALLFGTSSHYRRVGRRPIVGGISGGHYKMTAGTIGGVIIDKNTGKKYLLSNNHVFANTDTIQQTNAREGDPIYQPGKLDGGGSFDIVATLHRWIKFNERSTSNIVDAAIAKPVDTITFPSPYILADPSLNVIRVNGIKSVSGSIPVKKYSRTSDVDAGYIIDTDATVTVGYDGGKSVIFKDQILAIIECQGGDSGSLLLDMDDNAVGLVFAGGIAPNGDIVCIANKIRNVFAMLEADGEDFDVATPSSATKPTWANDIIGDTHVDPSDDVPTSTTAPLTPILALGAFGFGALIALRLVDR